MKRNYSIDFLRIFAICGVILIHVSSRSLAQGGYNIVGLWGTYFLERIGRFSVPLFFIISGYILSLRYKEILDLKKYYQKRVVRLLVPYVVWSIFYAFFNNKFHFPSISSLFFGIINGNTSIHTYFIPALLLLYFVFPMLRQIKFTKLTFILYTILEIFFLTINYFFPQPISSALLIAIFCLYPFIVGMLSFNFQKEIFEFSSKFRYVLTFFLGVVFYFVYQVTFSLFLPHRIISYIDSQWQPFIFAYSILLWFILMPILSKYQLSFASKLSKFVFFVYFIHIFYLSLFWKFAGSYLFSLTQSHVLFSWWFTPLVFIFVLTVSFVSAFLVSYVPKINKILGIE